jgi:putative transposase
MKKTDRILIPGHAHHLMHKSSNDQPIFRNDADATHFAGLIRDLSQRYDIRVHGWCLLPDRFHLLATPSQEANDLSLLMKGLTSQASLRQKQTHNETLSWEPRYRSSPVEPGQCLMACLCYIESLPATLGLVKSPFDHRLSSYRMRLGKTSPYWLDDPQEYLNLGDPKERAAAYRAYMHFGIDAEEADMIVTALRRGCLTGSSRFEKKVHEEFGVLVINRGPGRPPK